MGEESWVESELAGKVDQSAYTHVSPADHHHHHHFARPVGAALLPSSATLGRNSGRFGTGKPSPFRVVVPAGAGSSSTATPPVCSTPQQNSLPILDGLEPRERALPEFSTFGNQTNGLAPKPRNEPIEPSGHLV